MRTKQEAILLCSRRDGTGEAKNSEKEHFEANHPHGLREEPAAREAEIRYNSEDASLSWEPDGL